MAHGCGYENTINKQGPTPLKSRGGDKKSTGGEKYMRKNKMRRIKKGIIKDPVTTNPEYLAAQKKYDSLKKANPELAREFKSKMNSADKDRCKS